jgi:carotenoid 1,2-hydratase
MHWNGTSLVITIDEISSPPLISRVRGTITVRPKSITSVELPLAQDGTHIWRPFAPVSEITVDLEAPGWQWTGEGYFDANFGTRALEQDFRYWTWACYPKSDGATAFYDVVRKDGSTFDCAVAFGPDGAARMVAAPPATPFKRSLWQVRRTTRADPGTTPKQTLNMLDAPFYSRSAVTTQLDGQTVTGVHEALDLTRFASPLLKPMLALRVPRRAHWHHQV